MKKKLLILGNEEFFGEKGNDGYDGFSEFFDIEVISLNRIFIKYDKKSTIRIKKNNLIKEFNSKPDIVYVYNVSFLGSEFYCNLLKILKDNYNCNIFQYELLSKRFGKIDVYERLISIGLGKRIIPSIIGNYNELNKKIKLIYPLSKKSLSSKGKNIFLKSTYDLEYHIDDLHQKYIENKGDIRIFVLGDIMIGYKREKSDFNKIVNNLSQGGVAKKFFIPLRMKKEVSIIIKQFELELCGIDYIFDVVDKKRYILEINLVPGTQGIRQLYDKNFYKKIGKYLLDKLNNEGKNIC